MIKIKKGKFLTISSILAISLVFLTGCSNNSARQSNANSNPQATSTNQANNAKNGRMLDYGQPDRSADVRGVVKSITGNEATILLMAANPTDGRRASSSQEASTTNNPNTPVVSLTGAASNPGQGGGGGGQGGGRAGGGQVGGSTDRTAMFEKMKELSTGEDKIIIPVGIQMLKSSSDTKNKEMVEATLSDITVDKFITIWLNASVTDKKVAEFVLIN